MKRADNFCAELPQDYEQVKVIDAKNNKKFIIAMNAAAILMTLAVGFFAILLRFGLPIDMESVFSGPTELLVADVVFLVSMVAYVILHELTHGIVYKVMTGQKLTFGLTLTVAFCGVPNIYVNRKTALVAVLAPFVLFSVIFIPLIAFLPDPYALAAALVFAIHFGGCAGDLYDAILMIFGMKGQLLMRDTGPVQTFYLKKKG